jgi:hypothetical protein
MLQDRFRWVSRLSPEGIAYSFVERQVPRIPDEMLECVVYLYPSEAAAEDGEQIGGTGFIIGIPIPYTQPAPYHLLCVVTNKHVIDGGSMVVRVNTIDGSKTTIALDNAKWFLHPSGDDVALCPIGMNFKLHKVKFIHPNTFLRKEIVGMFDIGRGDDVFVIGRFINREGRQKNTPSLRFGNISQMPDDGDPIILDDGTAQECFLVEARSIPGFSGAPVFVQIIPEPPEHPPFPPNLKQYEPKPSTKRPKMDFKAGPFLMGIDCCHIFNRDPVINAITGEPMPNLYVRSNTGMMGVVPMWRIMDIVDGREMKLLRDTMEKEVKRTKPTEPHGAMDSAVPSASASDTDANPNHLADFTRLVDVAARKKPKD